ncbi:hypothetical protein [Mycolicibacterium confluentis]|uniref:Uncharacterized protein n=1 Tax=Mycolicibacterium confluentis TaxID=28047 RepID=A0A7I7XYQ4_9MYCO|nr:hypothetical protein [Mycolicibacterium confluentis]MCV7317829.1 hypothetical protein [Mycolicibacterium confluentis]BBZ34121.1 hypothetical protein MCNF_27260 [Mycolicibacterium confluentis]
MSKKNKGKPQQRPICMFCGSDSPVTREHVFRSSWKKTLETGEYMTGLPGVERKFQRFSQADGTMVYDRSEDLFSVVVKRVCEKCNNEWMNDLDSIVEPWVFEPDNDDNRCDPRVFRRWAIKVALLRAYYDNRFLVHSDDPPRIYADQDIPEWRVFIGRSLLPEHRHALCGVGPVVYAAPGGQPFGITQVSWTLGHGVVTALRIWGTDEVSTNCFKNFRQYNRVRGGVVREVRASDSEMPTVRLLPPLSEEQIQELVWLFTPHPVSPIADDVRSANEWVFEFMEEQGMEWLGDQPPPRDL